MKRMFLVLAASASIAGCTTAERNAVIGAGAGAVVGGAVSGDLEGAAIGAAAGGVGAYVLTRVVDRPGYCVYEDRSSGRRYEAECPNNY